MHTLLAIHDPGGTSIDEACCASMLSALAHRPREQQGAWSGDGSWLAALGWPTTAHEAREPQPWHGNYGAGAMVVAFDGRIDNRGELHDLLGVAAEQLAQEGDAALVLRAYTRWGGQAWARLLGDYALVLCDVAHHRLVAARDPSGNRPLFYALRHGSALLASEPSCLIAAGIDASPDENSVTERLFNTALGNDRTLYRHIYRLPPAHQLVVDRSGVRRSRFHCWSNTKPIRYRRDEDYAHHFRDTFGRAVACRLTSPHPIAIELSGGLDSSSICVVARNLNNVQPTQLAAYSLIFPGLPCDEQSYMRAVIDKTKLAHNTFQPEHMDIALAARQAERDQDLPAYPNGMMSRPLRQHAQQQGYRVTLTGSGSDEWWTGSSLDVAELLRRRQLRPALAVAMQQAHDGWGAGLILRHALAPQVPWPLRALRQRLRQHQQPWPWIQRGLLRRSDTLERMRTPPRLDRSRDLAVQDIVAVAEEGWNMHAHEMEVREAASFGIEIRQPFHDRRICEWALGVPLEQRARGGLIKFLLRQALRAELPEQIRTRTSKAEFSHLYLRALEAAEAVLKGSALVIEERGWVHGTALWKAVADIRARARAEPGGRVNARRDSAAVQALWCALALELWLRSAQRKRV